MVDNPIAEVVKRATAVAENYGTSFVMVRFDAEAQEFLFNIIPPEHVTVSYDKTGA